MLRRAPNRNASVQVFGGRGAGKTRAGAGLGEHQMLVEADTQQVTTFGSSQVMTVTTGYRLKCGCGYGDYAGTYEDAQRLMHAHLDGELDEAIEKLEPVELTPRDREDARVRQGTIERLLDE